jgi:hypothetical protein
MLTTQNDQLALWNVERLENWGMCKVKGKNNITNDQYV